jgi:hypothetical protein
VKRRAIHGQLLSFSSYIGGSSLVELQLLLKLYRILSVPCQQSIAICISTDELFPSFGDVEILVYLLQEAFDDQRLRPASCCKVLLFIMLGDMNKPPYASLARISGVGIRLRKRTWIQELKNIRYIRIRHPAWPHEPGPVWDRGEAWHHSDDDPYSDENPSFKSRHPNLG